ncbi:MAG: hypothetical protein V2J25_14115 [Desulfatiglans sp.]|jgi:hypothetical protein|nr:hypothetical protein [Thermodesulfobacteriota bacterium]MEE4353993.1 hypothetical protein [Desulfatiglans sp.]
MEPHKAIIAFSQSEKIKSGLIWVSQSLELMSGLSAQEKQGAEKIIVSMVNMVASEIQLARKVTSDTAWGDVNKSIDQALVMINSKVASESVVHLTQALSLVTGIAQRSMSFLKEEGLL